MINFLKVNLFLILFLQFGCSKMVNLNFEESKRRLKDLVYINNFTEKTFSQCSSEIFEKKFFIKEDGDKKFIVIHKVPYNIIVSGSLTICIELIKLDKNKTKLKVNYYDYGRVFFMPIFVNPGLFKEKRFIKEFMALGQNKDRSEKPSKTATPKKASEE